MNAPADGPNEVSFEQVLADELARIAQARHFRSGASGLPRDEKPRPAADAPSRALEANLAGLAFSGGGIRSATFNLGVLQALARLRVLGQFDYLSTVSGGGYIGSWLVAWIKREQHGLDAVQRQLDPNRVDQAAFVPGGNNQSLDEPEPIHHLRDYSQYLAPRRGIFSADSWVLGVIFFRNFLLNLLVPLPALFTLLLLCRLVILGFHPDFQTPVLWYAEAGLLAGLVLWICGAISLNLEELARIRGHAEDDRPPLQKQAQRFHWRLVLPLVACSFLLTHLIYSRPAGLGEPLERFGESVFAALDPQMRAALLCAFAFGMLPVIGHFTVGFLTRSRTTTLDAPAQVVRPWPRTWLVVRGLSGFAGGFALFQLLALLFDGSAAYPYGLALTVAFGPPLAMMGFVLSTMVEVAVLRNWISEDVREWWASLAARVGIYAVAWASLFGVLPLAQWLAEHAHHLVVPLWGGWLASTLVSLLAGKSERTGEKEPRNRTLDLLARLGPHIFLAGLLIACSLLVDHLTGWSLEPNIESPLPEMLGLGLLVCLAVVPLAWFIDINLFSLQNLYANRLSRCYLGASRRKSEQATRRRLGRRIGNLKGPSRQPHAITGFDPLDDLPLSELGKDDYTGPLLLVNTALNLTQGDELAWQERQAAAFCLSPFYCGSVETGYRPTNEYAGGLRLGQAVAISGAAASPNMGYHSSPSVTALLTLFNVRLGSWLGNPMRHTWRHSSPPSGYYLFLELFGRTNSHSRYVNLSDGGHFENLGVYELVRRRCRYIVACDGGCDPEGKFDDLGNLIRKCRTDFGIRIDIDVAPLRLQPENGASRWHCAIGSVRYDDIDPTAPPGVLVYLKATLSGDEPTDVQQYAHANPTFPHQTTGDQFFNESQFESYRALGYHVAHGLFREAVDELEAGMFADDRTAELFAGVTRRWYPQPPEFEQNYLRSVAGCVEVAVAIREDERLHRLGLSMYPELAEQFGAASVPTEDADASRAVAELEMMTQLIQVMETAFLGLQLDSYHAHPINRGWMTAFRRWSGSPVFRQYWPALCGEYSPSFVRFCERELGLPRWDAAVLRLGPGDVAERVVLEQLGDEFLRDWRGEGSLATLLGQAGEGSPDRPRVWFMLHGPRGLPRQGPAPPLHTGLICGLVVAWPEVATARLFQLRVWLRGAYHDLSVAQRCLTSVLEDLAKESPEGTVQARLPRQASRTDASKIQREMWVHFFDRLGFRRVQLERDPQPVFQRALAP